MTKYLLDSNIYINFYEIYYKMEFFPSFWDKIKLILNENVIFPKVVSEETHKSDEFNNWMKENFERKILNHHEFADGWAEVLNHIDGSKFYSDISLERWSDDTIADPWIIAIAKKEGYVIVTGEISSKNLNEHKPTNKSPKIPDIAREFGVRCIGMNDFFKEVDLKI